MRRSMHSVSSLYRVEQTRYQNAWYEDSSGSEWAVERHRKAPTKKTPTQHCPSGCVLRRISEYSEQSRCGCEFQGGNGVRTVGFTINKTAQRYKEAAVLLEKRFQSVVISLVLYIWCSVECPSKKISKTTAGLLL